MAGVGGGGVGCGFAGAALHNTTARPTAAPLVPVVTANQHANCTPTTSTDPQLLPPSIPSPLLSRATPLSSIGHALPLALLHWVWFSLGWYLQPSPPLGYSLAPP